MAPAMLLTAASKLHFAPENVTMVTLARAYMAFPAQHP